MTRWVNPNRPVLRPSDMRPGDMAVDDDHAGGLDMVKAVDGGGRVAFVSRSSAAYVAFTPADFVMGWRPGHDE